MLVTSRIAYMLVYHYGLTQQQADKVVKVFFDLIKGALLRGEAVSLRNLGLFWPKTYAPRFRKNPRTQKPIGLMTERRIRFAPSEELEHLVRSKKKGISRT